MRLKASNCRVRDAPRFEAFARTLVQDEDFSFAIRDYDPLVHGVEQGSHVVRGKEGS